MLTKFYWEEKCTEVFQFDTRPNVQKPDSIVGSSGIALDHHVNRSHHLNHHSYLNHNNSNHRQNLDLSNASSSLDGSLASTGISQMGTSESFPRWFSERDSILDSMPKRCLETNGRMDMGSDVSDLNKVAFPLLCNTAQARRSIALCRRKDNNYVNGTKLLNIAEMSRGKRDSILKNEKDREVIKSGSMRLKGVWIPLARAIDLATTCCIIDQIFPLFESNPEAFVYNSLPSSVPDVDDSTSYISRRPVQLPPLPLFSGSHGPHSFHHSSISTGHNRQISRPSPHLQQSHHLSFSQAHQQHKLTHPQFSAFNDLNSNNDRLSVPSQIRPLRPAYPSPYPVYITSTAPSQSSDLQGPLSASDSPYPGHAPSDLHFPVGGDMRNFPTALPSRVIGSQHRNTRYSLPPSLSAVENLRPGASYQSQGSIMCETPFPTYMQQLPSTPNLKNFSTNQPMQQQQHQNHYNHQSINYFPQQYQQQPLAIPQGSGSPRSTAVPGLHPQQRQQQSQHSKIYQNHSPTFNGSLDLLDNTIMSSHGRTPSSATLKIGSNELHSTINTGNGVNSSSPQNSATIATAAEPNNLAASFGNLASAAGQSSQLLPTENLFERTRSGLPTASGTEGAYHGLDFHQSPMMMSISSQHDPSQRYHLQHHSFSQHQQHSTYPSNLGPGQISNSFPYPMSVVSTNPSVFEFVYDSPCSDVPGHQQHQSNHYCNRVSSPQSLENGQQSTMSPFGNTNCLAGNNCNEMLGSINRLHSGSPPNDLMDAQKCASLPLSMALPVQMDDLLMCSSNNSMIDDRYQDRHSKLEYDSPCLSLDICRQISQNKELLSYVDKREDRL